MTIRTTSLFAFFCSLMTLTPAFAISESIQGIIGMRGNQAFIRLRQTREALPVYGMTQELVADLQKMQDGDFIVGRGEVLTDRRMVALESIDTVGLRQILGAWRTANWNVFEFKDFNNVILYFPDAAVSTSPRATSRRQMSYTLAPGSGENWSIFMADRQGIHIGELQFAAGARRINMTLYDSETGRVHQRLELAPYRR